LQAGYDPADPGGAGRAVLHFELEDNGIFKQFNYGPWGEKSDCHWDKLAWRIGSTAVLQYQETFDGCGSTTADFKYSPGIIFAPNSLNAGEQWSLKGVSDSFYFENGQLVCKGLNKWRSVSSGVTTFEDGSHRVQTSTYEKQDWQHVAGAPAADLCPPGKNGSYGWGEKFTFSDALTEYSSNGQYIGRQPALVASTGGNTPNTAGGTDWDVRFSAWAPLQQAAAKP
jgi:hypothetical protein